MSQKFYIKCLECGTSNVNVDYCENCGSLINITLKRKIERERKIQNDTEQKSIEKPNKIDEFLKSLTEHPNSFVRFLSKILYSLWLFFALVLGGIIASAIAIAAG